MKNVSIIINGAKEKTTGGKTTTEYVDQKITPVRTEHIENRILLYFRDDQLPRSFMFKKAHGIKGEKVEVRKQKNDHGIEWVFVFSVPGENFC